MSTADPMTGICGAKTRAKKPCKRPAGAGTSHVGVGRCKLHGGASPQAEVSGAVELARREAVVMGRPLDIEPHEALLECVRIAAGEVQYASWQIELLTPEDAVGPVVTTRPLKWEKGAESPTERIEEHGPPALHIWIEVRHRAMDRLANYSRIALAAGVAERQVRVAESQAQLMAQAVRGILQDLGVAGHPDAPRIVRRHLTLLAGGVADDARAA